MSNMTHCMFFNTSQDLQDCIDRLYEMESGEKAISVSDSERRYIGEMLEQCKTFLEYEDFLIEDLDL